MSTLSTTHVNKTTDTRMKTHTSDNYDLIHNAKLNLSMQSHTHTEIRFVKTHRFDDNVTECSRSQVLAFSEGETRRDTFPLVLFEQLLSDASTRPELFSTVTSFCFDLFFFHSSLPSMLPLPCLFSLALL